MALITGFKAAKYFTAGGRNPKRVYAAVFHMAEGGGTVSWLTHPSNNNSSTLVVEYDGDVWQMVKVGDMDHSLHVNTDPDNFDASDCGDLFSIKTAAKVLSPATGLTLSNREAVLPYICSIEVEGFAKDGPNAKQKAALRDKVAPWLRLNFPNLRGNLGHRDFQDYKTCPGCKFPWAEIGGHGLFSSPPTVQEEPLQTFTWNATTAKLGNLTVKTDVPHSYLRLADGTLHSITPPFNKRAFGPVVLLKGIGDDTLARRTGYIVPDEAAFVLQTDVNFVADTTVNADALKAELAATTAKLETTAATLAAKTTELAVANLKISKAKAELA